ncbi:BTB domain-containing protein 1 Regulator of chromosome condensation and [Collichthys lucidus]|uniref:BTB domain-containing protein 1 Regulator of chromosome condensation and n=1 Tax=Collichthys lucidus TaxID=240159 RepID=A0A4U5UVY2_COLLU|nr:BTB domain-containing protein 1 Regulator of chromosome condensation and [Collichthys lucidus]
MFGEHFSFGSGLIFLRIILTSERKGALQEQNDYGQIGSGSNGNAVVPRFVEGVDHVSKVTCGANHSLALTGDGRLFQWGCGRSCGNLKRNIPFPEEVMRPSWPCNADIFDIYQIQQYLLLTVRDIALCRHRIGAVRALCPGERASVSAAVFLEGCRKSQRPLFRFVQKHSSEPETRNDVLFHTLYKYSRTRVKRADDEREIEEERKEMERQRKERTKRESELMGTAERGEEEIYQETRVIFNDPFPSVNQDQALVPNRSPNRTRRVSSHASPPTDNLICAQV